MVCRVVFVLLHVLVCQTIEFSPALPARKLTAIQRLGMGSINKIVLRFPSVFWDRNIDWIACNIDLDQLTFATAAVTTTTTTTATTTTTTTTAATATLVSSRTSSMVSSAPLPVSSLSSTNTLHRSRHNAWFLNYYPIVKEPILVVSVTAALNDLFTSLTDKQVPSLEC
jgi:hypothetical protein